ncbi:MAG: tRNA glutamyl-Q(34) synthetase GluQRS [Saccharospirillaceae bacterium]|nr:tRNA glutamyl-Q(34) synthetase GluQRS [Saccharospirillaceae bacterium]MCD8530612.1 tRNA glutamyl-Q(34) synthetase GluQRS [Saccharospirillaceae bacterium]
MSGTPAKPAPDHLLPYIGRFAPSPTGPLHFGSLLAAVASYLDARAHNGRWLVRIEDLDPPREDPSAAGAILHILEAYGLHWDGEVRYQSQRHDAYQQVLEQLIRGDLAFPCQCSRKQLGGRPHQGNCRCQAQQDIAWRFLCPADELCFDDGLQGVWCSQLREEIGDFVIKRRDGPWSYQLAVVSDDIDQGVTHIVRGIDLIDSTARQILLYQALCHTPPPLRPHPGRSGSQRAKAEQTESGAAVNNRTHRAYALAGTELVGPATSCCLTATDTRRAAHLGRCTLAATRTGRTAGTTGSCRLSA